MSNTPSQTTGGLIAFGQDPQEIEIRGPLANAINQALAEKDAEIERLRARVLEMEGWLQEHRIELPMCPNHPDQLCLPECGSDIRNQRCARG